MNESLNNQPQSVNDVDQPLVCKSCLAIKGLQLFEEWRRCQAEHKNAVESEAQLVELLIASEIELAAAVADVLRYPDRVVCNVKVSGIKILVEGYKGAVVDCAKKVVETTSNLQSIYSKLCSGDAYLHNMLSGDNTDSSFAHILQSAYIPTSVPAPPHNEEEKETATVADHTVTSTAITQNVDTGYYSQYNYTRNLNTTNSMFAHATTIIPTYTNTSNTNNTNNITNTTSRNFNNSAALYHWLEAQPRGARYMFPRDPAYTDYNREDPDTESDDADY